MKKLLYFMAVIAAVLFTACDELDHAIADQGDRIDQLEKLSIKGIEDQVTAINASMSDLEAVDQELDNYIKALETKVADLEKQLAADNSAELEKEIQAINALIEDLKAKDAELEKKIEDLKKYIDDEITATEDWAEATFATLEQYSEIQEEISAISLLIDQQKTDLTAAIEDAIDDLETSMQAWVNKTLAEGYYDIAAIDAKLKALEEKLEDADAALAKQIKDQQAALEQAKKDLTAAYEKAITEAIEANNGVIDEAIADAVEDVLKKVDTKLAVIDNTIAAIQKDIDALKSSVEAFKEQIGAISQSIKDLEEADKELKELIEALESDGSDYGDLIEQLKQKDAALEKQIADLKKYIDEDIKKYVDDEVGSVEDWANRTFVTLQQFSEIQTSLGSISTLLEQHGNDLTAVKESVSDLQDMIGDIEDAITEITDRLDDLEAAVAALQNRIQSIRFLSEYSDGSVEFASGSTTLKFILAPKAAAGEVEASHVTAFISRTKARTRAAGDPVALTVESVTGDAATGLMEVVVSAASLPADYWADGDDANVYICISDGNNDIISEMIPVFHIPYVTIAAAAQTRAAGDNTLKMSAAVNSLEYSTDGGATWNELGTNEVTFGNGTAVLLRGKAAEGTGNSGEYATIQITGEDVVCYGDIRTLIDWENHAGAETAGASFYGLFKGCEALVDASGLKLIPDGETMADECYAYMFSGCENLTETPELPATELSKGCYDNMFSYCTSLTEAPALPAPVLTENCYREMFAGCTGLESVIISATDTSAPGCMEDWIKDIPSEGFDVGATNAEGLQTAIDTAPAGSTIFLANDVEVSNSQTVVINSGKDIVFDLKEKTLSKTATSSSASNMIHVKAGAKVKIINGNLIFAATNPDTGWGGEGQPEYPGYANNTIRNEGNLITENVSIENKTKRGGASYVIDNYKGASLTVNANSVITQSGGDIAIRMFNGGEGTIDVTINGGTVTGHRAVWIQLASNAPAVAPTMNLTVTNGTLNSSDDEYKQAVYSYSYGNDMSKVTINVSDGTFNGDIALTGGSNKTKIETVNISGGTFNGPYGLYSYGEESKAKETITIKGGTFPNFDPLYYLGSGENTNVKLITDTNISGYSSVIIPKGANVIIDLNGYTLSQEYATTTTYAMIENKGNLTITDSSSEKNGKISYKDVTVYTADVNYASNTIRNEGTLTLEAGTIENISGDDVMNYGYPHAIDVYQGSTTNIKGGTVKSANYDCIRMFCNSTTLATTVNISGGNIINRVSFQNPSSNQAGYGRLNITGGTFTSTDNVNANVRLLNFSSDVSNMKAVISGGTFDKGVRTQNYGSGQVTQEDWLTIENVTVETVQ